MTCFFIVALFDTDENDEKGRENNAIISIKPGCPVVTKAKQSLLFISASPQNDYLSSRGAVIRLVLRPTFYISQT